MEQPDARARPLTPAWSLATRDVVASLVALATIGVAQPLLDLIGRNAAFLVAHEANRTDILYLAIGLPIVLPLLLAVAVLVLKRIAAPVAAVVHAVLLAGLGVVLMLVILRTTDQSGLLTPHLAFVVAAAAGIVVVLSYMASATLRRLLVVGAVAAPLVAAMFVYATPARSLAFPAAPPAAVTDIGEDAPPIVVVAFDELPIASLLTREGTIDRDAFPAFAALADDATFFRNATSVHGQTSDAVPAALTGNYPRADALPVTADHPQNLFALLGPTYDLHVVEPLTQLCPAGRCRSSVRDAAHYRALARDLAVVGSHMVLPEPLTRGLPPIDQGWRDFAATAAEEGKEGATIERFREARETDPAPQFEKFVGEIDAGGDAPALHFIHTLLPHSPWRYLPDGRRHSTDWYPSGLERGRWTSDEWRVTQGYQRHLVQLQLADRLLGKLTARLSETGLYDDALVVVMADHGAAFEPGESLRMMNRETFGEIGAVPLLVKPPGQQQSEVSDRPLEIVDILPTILDVIGAEIPAGIDGRSAFDRSVPERKTKRFFSAYGPLTFDSSGDHKWPIVERRALRFSAGDALPFPYNVAPAGLGHLLGRRIAAGAPSAEGWSVAIDNAAAYASMDLSAPLVQTHLHGTVRGEFSSAPILLISVNGTVAAVTRADLDGGPARRFRALLPPSSLRNGPNQIDVYTLDEAGVPLRIAPASFG